MVGGWIDLRVFQQDSPRSNTFGIVESVELLHLQKPNHIAEHIAINCRRTAAYANWSLAHLLQLFLFFLLSEWWWLRRRWWWGISGVVVAAFNRNTRWYDDRMMDQRRYWRMIASSSVLPRLLARRFATGRNSLIIAPYVWAAKLSIPCYYYY